MNKFVDLENNTWVKNNKFSEKNEIVFEKATNPKNVLGLIKNLNADIESFIDDWVRDGLLDGVDLSNKDFFTFKCCAYNQGYHYKKAFCIFVFDKLYLRC